ncbi:hypothetical protein ACHWQZ_G016872 [Mnemiopsis leidyi]
MAFCLPITSLNMDKNSLNMLSEPSVKLEISPPSLNFDSDLIKPTTPENVYSLSFQNIAEKNSLLLCSPTPPLGDEHRAISQPGSKTSSTLSSLLNLQATTSPSSPAVTSTLLQSSNLALLSKLPFLNQTKRPEEHKPGDHVSTVPTTCLPLPIPSNLPLLSTLNPQILNYSPSTQSISEILAKLAATKTTDNSSVALSSESNSLTSETLARLAGSGLVSPNLSSLQIPNIASNIKLESQRETTFATNGNDEDKSKTDPFSNVANIMSNSLNGQLEINKQLMTCLTVALDEIKELRKQLSEKGGVSTQAGDLKTLTLLSRASSELHSPSMEKGATEWDTDNVSTPGSVSPCPFSTDSQSTPTQLIDIKSLLKLGESKEWTIPTIKSLEQLPLGAKRTRAGDVKLKSNVPAACRSIVKNVYRELVRREAINAFDLHQGQESAHNVKIYWQVIEYIKKTTSNCSWEEADMLYAIRTYWRSLRDDRQRELSGKKYNHRRMIIRREIMKRKLKSRQKAIGLVNWGSEMKQLFEETLNLDYMSSEEEDNTVESREGPRPRVVRRLPWASATLTQCKADLDAEFKKICSARQLKATAHVYRRDHVISSRPKPLVCPQWAVDPNWVPENMNDSTEEKKEAAEKTKRPSMIPYDPSSPTSATTQLLGLSDEILKTLRDPSVVDFSNTVSPDNISTNSFQEDVSSDPTSTVDVLPSAGKLSNSPTTSSPDITPRTSTADNISTTTNIARDISTTTNIARDTNHVIMTDDHHHISQSQYQNTVQQTAPSGFEQELFSSLSEVDKALFESVVNTLAETNPRVRELNPIEVIMSLNMTSDSDNLGG